MPSQIIAASAVSQPLPVGAGSIVKVSPAVGATAVVEYTTADASAVANGVAAWAGWPKGTVGTETADLFNDNGYIRVTAAGGEVAVSVDNSPTIAALSAYKTDWGGSRNAPPFAALRLLTVRDTRPFCEAAPGSYIVAVNFAKQLGTFTGNIVTDNIVTAGGGNTVVSAKFNLNDATAAQGLYNNAGDAIVSGANSVIQQVWRLSTGTMLMLSNSHNATPAHAAFYLHRVAGNFDCGTSANNRRASLHLGANDANGVAAPVPGVRALHQRSLCEFTRNDGTKVVLLAEYNVANAGSNAPRTSGGTNDQVTVWQSTNDGVSFTRLLQFNTDGTHRFDHFHSVVYNPYTRRVYFLTGDTGDENAVIGWDGESAAPGATPGLNPTLAQIAAAPGWWIRYGNELCRYGDLVFAPGGGVYGLPDSDSNPELLGDVTQSIPAKNVDAYVSCQLSHSLDTVVAGKPVQRYKNIPPLIGLRHSSGAMVYGSLRTVDNGAGGNNVAGPTFEPFHWFWTSTEESPHEWNLAAKLRNFNNTATGNVLDLWEDSQGNVIAGATFSRGTSWGAASRTVSCAIFQVLMQAKRPTLVIHQ